MKIKKNNTRIAKKKITMSKYWYGNSRNNVEKFVLGKFDGKNREYIDY